MKSLEKRKCVLDEFTFFLMEIEYGDMMFLMWGGEFWESLSLMKIIYSSEDLKLARSRILNISLAA